MFEQQGNARLTRLQCVIACKALCAVLATEQFGNGSFYPNYWRGGGCGSDGDSAVGDSY